MSVRFAEKVGFFSPKVEGIINTPFGNPDSGRRKHMGVTPHNKKADACSDIQALKENLGFNITDFVWSDNINQEIFGFDNSPSPFHAKENMTRFLTNENTDPNISSNITNSNDDVKNVQRPACANTMFEICSTPAKSLPALSPNLVSTDFEHRSKAEAAPRPLRQQTPRYTKTVCPDSKSSMEYTPELAACGIASSCSTTPDNISPSAVNASEDDINTDHSRKSNPSTCNVPISFAGSPVSLCNSLITFTTPTVLNLNTPIAINNEVGSSTVSSNNNIHKSVDCNTSIVSSSGCSVQGGVARGRGPSMKKMHNNNTVKPPAVGEKLLTHVNEIITTVPKQSAPNSTNRSVTTMGSETAVSAIRSGSNKQAPSLSVVAISTPVATTTGGYTSRLTPEQIAASKVDRKRSLTLVIGGSASGAGRDISIQCDSFMLNKAIQFEGEERGSSGDDSGKVAIETTTTTSNSISVDAPPATAINKVKQRNNNDKKHRHRHHHRKHHHYDHESSSDIDNVTKSAESSLLPHHLNVNQQQQCNSTKMMISDKLSSNHEIILPNKSNTGKQCSYDDEDNDNDSTISTSHSTMCTTSTNCSTTTTTTAATLSSNQDSSYSLLSTIAPTTTPTPAPQMTNTAIVPREGFVGVAYQQDMRHYDSNEEADDEEESCSDTWQDSALTINNTNYNNNTNIALPRTSDSRKGINMSKSSANSLLFGMPPRRILQDTNIRSEIKKKNKKIVSTAPYYQEVEEQQVQHSSYNNDTKHNSSMATNYKSDYIVPYFMRPHNENNSHNDKIPNTIVIPATAVTESRYNSDVDKTDWAVVENQADLYDDDSNLFAEYSSVNEDSQPTDQHQEEEGRPLQQQQYTDDDDDSMSLASLLGGVMMMYDNNDTTMNTTCANTTMTLFGNHNDDDEDNESVSALDVTISSDQMMKSGDRRKNNKKNDTTGPCLSVMPLKRSKGVAEDIKEISFASCPGGVTTVMLTICNNKTNKGNNIIHKQHGKSAIRAASGSMRLTSQAVSLRFDEYASTSSSSSSAGNVLLRPHHNNTAAAVVDDSFFQVQPAELIIAPGEQGVLEITFTAQYHQQLLEGIFSGALKIRTNKKSYVLLLRGESRFNIIEQQQQQAVVANNKIMDQHDGRNNSIDNEDNNACLSTPPSAAVQVKYIHSAATIVAGTEANVVSTAPYTATMPIPASVVATAATTTTPPTVEATTKKVTKLLPILRGLSLSVQPDSLILQKSPTVLSNKYEAILTIEAKHLRGGGKRNGIMTTNSHDDANEDDFTEVHIVASTPFLKLSRSRILLANRDKESIKIMLDERSEELLNICNSLLSQDAATAFTTTAGFISIKNTNICNTSSSSQYDEEYTVDVSIARSTCFMIRQQQQQQQTVQHSSLATIPTPPSAQQLVLLQPQQQSSYLLANTPYATPSVEIASSATTTATSVNSNNNNNVDVFYREGDITTSSCNNTRITNATTAPYVVASSSEVEALPTTSQRRHRSNSNSSGSTTTTSNSTSNKNIVSSTPAIVQTYSEFDKSSIDVAKRICSAKQQHCIQNDEVVYVQTTAGICTTVNDESFARSKVNPSNKVSPTLLKPSDSSSNIHCDQQQLQSKQVSSSRKQLQHNQQQQQQSIMSSSSSFLMGKKTGVFFRKESINFGAVAIGSLTRANIELCNATDQQVTVYLGDPMLPFVLLHNEVSLRPRSYVRVPIRFLPVVSNSSIVNSDCNNSISNTTSSYCNELIAQTSEGDYHTKILLIGSAYA